MTITSAQVADQSEQALRLSDLPLPLGRSEGMRRVHDQIRRLAATTLIYGETGTGKELVATALHRLSRRGPGPTSATSLYASLPQRTNASATKWARSDFYYRLTVAMIELPPLRERREDIRTGDKILFVCANIKTAE